MKQYILKQIGDNEPIGKYSNKADAVDDMDTIIADHNEDLDSDDDGFLTPFDFTLEVVECQDVNETITNFDEARAFLGGKPNNDYTVSKKGVVRQLRSACRRYTFGSGRESKAH